MRSTEKGFKVDEKAERNVGRKNARKRRRYEDK